MNTIELDGVVDEAGHLTLIGPLPIAAGPVRVIVGPVLTDDDENEWRALVAHAWADSLNDPSEDIYTEADGLPVDPTTGDVIYERR